MRPLPRGTVASFLDASLSKQDLAPVIAGQESAVRRFVQELSPSLRGTVRRALKGRGDEPTVDDLLQDLYCEMFRNQARVLQSWDPALGRSLRGYLCCLAQYRTIAWLRRQRPTPMSDEELAKLRTAPHELLAGADDLPRMDELLELASAELSEGDLALLQMVLAGLSMEQIAQQLGISKGAVYQRWSRLCRKLRELWERL